MFLDEPRTTMKNLRTAAVSVIEEKSRSFV
jgi:hypothetical protein